MHDEFFLNLEIVPTPCIAKIISGGLLPQNGMIWEFTNELKPVDLYCYLYAKFGEPNGLQNLFRADDSDNLIHWEWTFACSDGLISILGLNFRSEVHLIGNFKDKGLTLDMFISQIKSDFKNYGNKITEFRTELEKWTQFVNPYKRIKNAVEENFTQLDALGLNPSADKLAHPANAEDIGNFTNQWQALNYRYSAAVGLVFGLRAMLPVLAESFINLLLYVLTKPEIKSNERVYQNVLRQPIDIRIQSLHLNCVGFTRAVDYSSEECKAFHTLMNERNDLLHGNVEVEKLSIGDVYFRGKVPLFLKYDDFWSISIGASMNSVRFDDIHKDYETVKNFVKFIKTHLNEALIEHMDMILDKTPLGLNKKTGRLGILFSDRIADFRMKTSPGLNDEAI